MSPTPIADRAENSQTGTPLQEETVSLGHFLVALDASEHADRALTEALAVLGPAKGRVTGIHAYAARLHDARFRQMEGGLPERYLEEKEMRHQRDIHDDLIGHGLNIISDSYHDVAESVCGEAGLPFDRLSPEGKNYRKILEAAQTGDFEVLALGAIGLGAVPGSVVGTVCERVVRRSPIDVLVIRNSARAIADGPIVVGIDGSAKSYGVLRTAFELAGRLGTEVHAVAAYDPYYHYVAFNKIAGVLSEEAGKVFRFKEQEALHEELIDDGIAKIYQSHLEVARKIASENGGELTTKLLDGKAYKVVAEYLTEVDAGLLMVGKTGVHADAELDIGGNAENLLRMAPCHIWLGQTTHVPPMEVIADETISWSHEAEEFLGRAPDFVQGMARKAVLRFAQEKGHTFITADIVEEVAYQLMPGRGKKFDTPEIEPLEWNDEARALMDRVTDPTVANGIRLRAEKRARVEGATKVSPDHVTPFLGSDANKTRSWSAAALARLTRVPEAMRDAARARVETVAAERDVDEITLEIAEAGLALAREAMKAAVEEGETKFVCPFAAKSKAKKAAAAAPELRWTEEAEARMARIPEGFMRDMTRQRVETFAERNGVTEITPQLIEEKYAEWGAGSAKQKRKLPWDEAALARIERIPDFVRGMVSLEIERCAREMGSTTVTEAAVDKASAMWGKAGAFHSDMKPNLYKGEE